MGLVKLMGRQSGFIACYASLPINDAEFRAYSGGAGIPARRRTRLACRSSQADRTTGTCRHRRRRGAGQGDLCGSASDQTDASGNPRLHEVGLLLKQRISEDFASRGQELNLKYIDPSYTIRSVPANAYDSGYCIRLAHSAVHAAMCGRTEMLVGRWHGRFVHVPMQLAIRERNTVDPHGDLWDAVLESTGQPRTF